MDPLADVLDLARVRGALLANVRAGAPWGLALPQSDGASFHAVTSGTAWMHVEGHEPLQLMPGDLVLLPSGAPHTMSSDLTVDCPPYVKTAGELALGGSGAVTTLACAGYSYDLEVAPRLMALLPEVLHVPADPVAGRDAAAIVDLLAREVGDRGAGSRTAVARLSDLLLIAAIRAWRPDAPSWLAALHDPVVSRALALLHERPGDAWTLEALAREVHLSRATLARRFAAAVGEPPLAYLASWRMDIAARRLRTSSDPIEAIAREVGYSSEYAFNRAFARHRGEPPGRYRRGTLPARWRTR
jgi:AraC-like DNA-binding protein